MFENSVRVDVDLLSHGRSHKKNKKKFNELNVAVTLHIRPLFLHYHHQSFLPDSKTWALLVRDATHHLPLGQLLAGLDKDFFTPFIAF